MFSKEWSFSPANMTQQDVFVQLGSKLLSGIDSIPIFDTWRSSYSENAPPISSIQDQFLQFCYRWNLQVLRGEVP